MRNLALAAVTFFAVATVAGAEVSKGTYVGTSSTLVRYLNPNTLETVAQERFARKLRVFIGDPKSTGGQTEANPFTLTVSPKPRANVPGEVFAQSARILPVSGTPTLVQYWTLQNTATGFNGALADNHSDSALAKDRVVANLGGPGGTPSAFLMHDPRVGAGLQCTCEAVLDGDKMTLKIRGYAFVPGQAIIRFNTKIVAMKQATPSPFLELVAE